MTAAAPAAEKIRVFFSYAHEDKTTRDELEKYLIHLERTQMISVWSDCELIAGQNWDERIKQQLAGAHLILLLLSIDFLNSQYIWDTELKIALERHHQGKVRLVPILLRPLPEGSNPFGAIQGLPSEFRAVDLWSNRDQAFVSIADGIKSAVEDLVREARSGKISVEGSVLPAGWQPRSHIFCDRDEQEFEFLTTCRGLLRARPGIPQVYVIRGEPMDRPDTLVERLYRGKIPTLASSRTREKRARLYPKILRTPERELRWPDVGIMLADDLFQTADLSDRYVAGYGIKEVNGSELVNAAEIQPYSFVVVRHDIDASRLGSGTGELLKWYINDFYAGLKGGTELPQLLVFLNVIFRESASSPLRWRFWKSARPAPGVREIVNEALEQVCTPVQNRSANMDPASTGCPCKLLKELSPLDEDHIQRWLLESEPRPTESEAGREAKSIFDELSARSTGPVRLDALATWVMERESRNEQSGNYQSI